MKISVITPCFNSAAYIGETLDSVLTQEDGSFELEYIVVDGASTDGTLDVLERYRDRLAVVVSEPDQGPADAINKGFGMATGDLICWLNADDIYQAGALARVAAYFAENPDTAMLFGHCPIVNEQGQEIRKGITRFKEFFYPLSSRFTFQCINYISQPATFYNRQAVERAGALRLDMVAAWDYAFFLGMWKQGPVRRLDRPPLAAFRWHPRSISGVNFAKQFKEEFEAACEDAGKVSLQAMAHWFVRWGIVGCYSLMSMGRTQRPKADGLENA